MRFQWVCLLNLILLLASPVAFTVSTSAHAADGRQKVIDFEDEVVEGVNKRPLDSVSQLSERDRRRKKPHLYRKRHSFKSETAQTLSEIRYVQ
ncbi:MAG: hypothetical protein H7222_07105 [Methylotenera sp.]|nr:hypothetical protein [Oligoflexia bacterium]